MDFKSFLGNPKKASTEEKNQSEEKKPQSTPSNSELFSSAKIVAEAAKSSFSNQSDKVDKAKVAEAGADLLDAAETYGKLEEKGYGSYVDKAEEYLHNYNSSSQSPTKPVDSGAPAKHSSEKEESGGGYMKMAEGLLHSGSGDGKKTSGDEEKSEGGGYMKMAEGLFNSGSGDAKKTSGDEEKSEGGGYMKMAEGLFKK